MYSIYDCSAYFAVPGFSAILASPGYAVLLLSCFLLAHWMRLTSFVAQPQLSFCCQKKKGKGRRRQRVKGNQRKKMKTTRMRLEEEEEEAMETSTTDDDHEDDDEVGRKSSEDEGNSGGGDFVDLAEVLEQCPILQEVYTPPPVWGRNGHLQTATYGLLGHHSLRRCFDKRHHLRLPDGATATCDVFEPLCAHHTGDDFTLVLCPGIANCSESNYIRTCVHLIQERGYRSAVLNHLGVLKSERLTSERIFSYGGSGELEAMFRLLASLYPHTRFLAVGFSMGANVLTNCLARLEPPIRSRILLGVSVCQGYSATDAALLLMDYCSRRFYNYVITENVKRLLRRNYEMAVRPHVQSGLINEQHLWAATSLHWLDECYSRRVHGFDSLEAYYAHSSCLPRIRDIPVPMVFVNALDDPLVPEALWAPVRDLCLTHPRHAFVLLKHGGHLGFLEASSPLRPHSVTWLDRFILQLAEAATTGLAPHGNGNNGDICTSNGGNVFGGLGPSCSSDSSRSSAAQSSALAQQTATTATASESLTSMTATEATTSDEEEMPSKTATTTAEEEEVKEAEKDDDDILKAADESEEEIDI